MSLGFKFALFSDRFCQDTLSIETALNLSSLTSYRVMAVIFLLPPCGQVAFSAEQFPEIISQVLLKVYNVSRHSSCSGRYSREQSTGSEHSDLVLLILLSLSSSVWLGVDVHRNTSFFRKTRKTPFLDSGIPESCLWLLWLSPASAHFFMFYLKFIIH